MPALTNPRHEHFAQELAKGKSASEAYVLAGYLANDGNASRLKGNEKIEGRVVELLNRAAIRAEVTVASIIAELEQARLLAAKTAQPASMVSASMGKAKVAGILTDRVEHTGKDGGPIQTEDVSAVDVIASRISRIAARTGEDERPSRTH